MDFAAFLIVNVLLFIRPQEMMPELEKVPLYYFSMLACIGTSIVPLMNLVFTSGIMRHPTVVFTFLMLLLAAVSLVVNVPDKAFDEELEYVKVVTYFVLFVAIVRTPARLQGVIACVAICMALTATIGMLHFYDVINIPNLKQLEENHGLRPDGEQEAMRRLRFTGILDGPNEVAVFLGVLTFLCSYQLTDVKQGAGRYLWIVPIGLYLTCIILTRSRGGLLALLVGIVVFAIYEAGRKRAPGQKSNAAIFQAVGLTLLAIPALLFAAGGRQTEFNANATTAKTRFAEWDAWFYKFRESPLIGVSPQLVPRARANPSGGNVPGDEPGEELLAHNSYLQSFADLGFLGGLAFLGIVSFSFITMHRFGFNKTAIFNPDLARLQPFVIAALACCATGFMTLSIDYLIPVYFVIAIPVAYYGMTQCLPPIKPPALSSTALAGLAAGSIAFLGFIYVVIRIMPKE